MSFNRIAVVTDAWFPQINGVVNTLNSTIDILQKRGIDVKVIEPSSYFGIKLDYLSHGLKLSLPYNIGSQLENVDAIHISTEGPLGFAAKLYCDKRGLPYTTAFHTNFPYYFNANFGIPKKIIFGVLNWFHAHSKAVMVPSQSMIGEIRAAGIKNTVLWARGVDQDVFHPQMYPSDIIVGLNDEFYTRPFWLNVGRVSGEKNIEAFLSLKLPGTKFIVGTGPALKTLKRLYTDVKFLGVKRGAELAAIYRTADVFVFPSRSDTFGLVNIEAISCGTPVAAYPVTGPKDIIKENVTGVINDDLKIACLKALKLGRVYDNFSWEDATDQFVSYLYRI